MDKTKLNNGISLTEDDKQIFVTALNKLNNPRAREIVTSFCSHDGFKQILDNQEIRKEFPTILGERTGYKLKSEELEQEIKQLKEDLESFKRVMHQQVNDKEELKQKLEKIKGLDIIFGLDNFLRELREILHSTEHSTCKTESK